MNTLPIPVLKIIADHLQEPRDFWNFSALCKRTYSCAQKILKSNIFLDLENKFLDLKDKYHKISFLDLKDKYKYTIIKEKIIMEDRIKKLRGIDEQGNCLNNGLIHLAFLEKKKADEEFKAYNDRVWARLYHLEDKEKNFNELQKELDSYVTAWDFNRPKAGLFVHLVWLEEIIQKRTEMEARINLLRGVDKISGKCLDNGLIHQAFLNKDQNEYQKLKAELDSYVTAWNHHRPKAGPFVDLINREAKLMESPMIVDLVNRQSAAKVADCLKEEKQRIEELESELKLLFQNSFTSYRYSKTKEKLFYDSHKSNEIIKKTQNKILELTKEEHDIEQFNCPVTIEIMSLPVFEDEHTSKQHKHHLDAQTLARFNDNTNDNTIECCLCRQITIKHYYQIDFELQLHILSVLLKKKWGV